MKNPLLIVILALVTLSACVPSETRVDRPAWHPFKSEKDGKKFLASYDAWAKKWPVPSGTRMVNTTFGSTFVRISGPEGAPALVLLHGVSGNGLQWLPNAKDLSSRFRIYVVDTISDNGRSVYTRLPKSADDFVVWLDELFDGLGLRTHINMMGLSFGGWITAHYGLAKPERLDRIVLAAPVGAVQEINPEWIKRAIKIAIFPSKKNMDAFSAWQAPYYLAEHPAEAREWFDNAYLAFRSFRKKPMVPPTILSDAELASFKVPVLFLAGDHEVIFDTQKAMDRVHRLAPGIRTFLVKDACHDLTAARAAAVDSAVIGFLGQ